MNKRILIAIFAAICVALILGTVVYNLPNLQVGETNSDSVLPESTTPEEPTETLPENKSELTESPSDNHSLTYLIELEQLLSTPNTVGAIVVPDDYPTIQQAVDNASDGDMIFVRKGQYNETVTVDKSLWLLGEEKQSTIINAHSVGPDVLIIHDNVNVTGFKMVNTPTPSEGTWFLPGYVPSKHFPDIKIINSSYCNIYGNNLTDGSVGVRIEGSSQISVIGNEIRHNGGDVELVTSTDSLIANNVIKGGNVGIKLASSNINSLINNTITDVPNAISLGSSSNNLLRDNKLMNSFTSFGVKGSNLSAFVNDVDTSNTIDDKPIYYWIGKSNQAVPSDAACIVLVNCTGMTIQDLKLPLNYRGIILANTNNSIIRNNKLADLNLTSEHVDYALDILFFSSFNNDVEKNRVNLYLDSSSNNRIAHNTGTFHLDGSDFNEITENNITKISFVSGDWSGIVLSNSSNNQIIRNIISNNKKGISIYDFANNNRIIENDINDNNQGGIVIFSERMLTSIGGTVTSIARNTIIFNNTITANSNWGISDSGQSTNIICNTIKYSSIGIAIQDGDNASIVGNEIESFHFGDIDGRNATNCRVIGNNIRINSIYSQYDVELNSNYPGTFYHNNFFCDADIRTEFSHVWDNGSEGNYWINYTGTDNDGDGIGDTPYEIGNNNFDNYPLMSPFDISTIPIEVPEWTPQPPSP